MAILCRAAKNSLRGTLTVGVFKISFLHFYGGGTTGMQFRRFSYSNLKNRFSSHHITV